MMKRNSPFLAAALLSIGLLYAFSNQTSVSQSVLTLLFPIAEPPIAPAYPEAEMPTIWKNNNFSAPPDTNPPLVDRPNDFLNGNPNTIDLKDPSAIEQSVEYDPVTNTYIITEKVGEDFFRMPTYMTFDEYVKWRDEKQQDAYFDRLQGVVTPGGKKSYAGVDPIAKFNIQNSLIDRLFGGTEVDIKPQGNINLTFGVDYQKLSNPILTLRQQKTTNFDFDMDINMSAQGKIGEKLNLNFNYNTQATFDFDNQMKINYDSKTGGDEDGLLQNIQAGNVSLPLRSNLIKGAQNLFGIMADLKFGHLRTKIIASQQRSRQQNLTVQGGSQLQVFEKPIDEYDENRHFFVSQWNRTQFEPAMKCLPVPQSQFTITRMEVWITNDKLLTENVRDVVALADLGESTIFTDPSSQFLSTPVALDFKNQGLPTNKNNLLYPEILERLSVDSAFRYSDRVITGLKELGTAPLKQIRDFEKVRGRLLSSQEYSYNDQLGFLSINLNVQPDQVVGVAYEYTYNGQPYKVGEFSSDVPSGDSLNQNVLFLKMLKSTTANVRFPIWDLMMKNVYSVGAANVDEKEFRFDIFYEDPGQGQKRFLDDDAIPLALRSKPLLQIFKLDNLNLQGDPGPDGIFDYVPGLTVNLRSGRVMFPILEPFGKFLSDTLTNAAGGSADIAKKYAYPQLYDSTIFRAREYQQLNRFILKGSYKSSSSSEISLGTFNLPPGSVRVSAGSFQMVEGRDYVVDYNIGKVRILNDAVLQSGQNVNISFEDNTLFGFQNRTMLGARFDYEFSKDLIVGGTFMNLFERPLTQKVNFGDDPINNKVYGLDFSLSKGAPWLTKFVDNIPFINTKEPSSITATAEVALLDPGFNRAINQGDEKGGTVYIDDFEGSTSNVPLSFPAFSWVIASTPQGDATLFPESELLTDEERLGINANRSAMSWYVADPAAIDGVDANNPYSKRIPFQNIFPNRQLSPLEQSNLRSLDVTIYPRDRGPYNYEKPSGYGPGISAGFNDQGQLNLPETRWSGFMRGLQNNNDFEAANIEFMEFWVLNPYMAVNNAPVSNAGTMYIDLGSISEDIMRDSRQFFENSIPTQPNGATVNTVWGRVPVLPPIVNAFANDNAQRALQDIGLDGLDDAGESAFFAEWKTLIENSSLATSAKTQLLSDVSNDNFVYFGDPTYGTQGQGVGLLQRYKKFNNTQGNSPVNQNTTVGQGNFFANQSSTNFPDMEDLNQDNSLNESEAYYRYKIELNKVIDNGIEVLDVNDPNLRDLITDVRDYVDESNTRFVWYRFKLPLDLKTRQEIGGIQDFRSIRFIRMFWKGFTEQTTFRFATLELGRNQWRRFTQYDPACQVDGGSQTTFDINAVSIEENSARQPFNYTIPFGIQRERSVGAFPDILQNEQALSMSVCNLTNCDFRGIFKTLNMDLRQFDRIKMFAHAENLSTTDVIEPGEMKIFMRLGSDFVNNYYEYEVPLIASDPNALNNNPETKEYKLEVWKPGNDFDFPLNLLIKAKTERNEVNPPFPAGDEYIIPDPDKPDNKVKVVGNPNLGYVKGIMLGVRNTNGESKCVEVWFNELRLNGFNEQGGYAGLGRVDMKLADLGNLSLSGAYSSIGWGGIDQKLNQRQREEVIQYDISTNLELSKFLPEKLGLKLPFYAQYSNVTRNPEYDPYDLDIKLRDKIRRSTDATERKEIKSLAQDVTITKGYNFTNVRKERKGGARKIPLPWNIENFSLTYAHNREQRRTPFIQNAAIDQHKGSLDWQYSTGIKPIAPFKKLIKKDKYLKFLSEFNLNPLPNTYGFNSTLERFDGVTTYRFAGEDPKLNTYHNRRFTWDRNYDLGWDIARSLRFNFDATARSIIDEPLQTKADGQEVTTQERRDSIWTNFKKLGRPKNYTHTAALNYTLPFKTIPFMDFITMKASYTAGYTWSAQSLKLQALDAAPQYENIAVARNLGHVIQNNNTRQINGDFNFETLYNKSKYLAKINKPTKAPAGGKGKTPGGRGGDPAGGLEGIEGSGGMFPGGRGGDKGKDGKAADNPDSKDKSGKDVAGGGKDAKSGGVGPDGKPLPPDDKSKKDKDKKKKEKKDRMPSMAERIALRPLMLVRKARFTYSETFATVVPGFVPETQLMGLSEGFNAPGWAFVAGIQPERSWLDQAARNGWITHREELNQQVTRNYTQNFDAGLTIEPFKDFRVELTANRQFTRNQTELFKDQARDLNPESVNFQHNAQRVLGSYTMSFFTLKTLIGTDINTLFDTYENNRRDISTRLAITNSAPLQPHERDSAYTKGYGKIQQQVLIPAFMAAYTGKDPSKVGLNLFQTLPSPNWKFTYNGLSKIGNLDKIFSSIQISHGYKNTLTVNSYNTDLFFNPETPYQTSGDDYNLNFNYIARFEIPQILINEQLSPLISVDVKLKNEMTFKVDMKKTRQLALSFTDYQLAETKSESYTVGFGYRMKNVNIPFLTGKKFLKGKAKSSKSKKKKKKKSTTAPAGGAPAPGGTTQQQGNDLSFKFDFEYRDDITQNHRLDLPIPAEPTRGARTVSINPSVEYTLSKRLKLRLFLDYRNTTPKTSQSFPIKTINSGVTVQFTLN